MSRPPLLDLFCGAGGAAVGYYRAGFDVVGVDIKPQPHYPFEFIQADAIDVLSTWSIGPWAALHASPPCQAYSKASQAARNKGRDYPDLVAPTRDLLVRTGLPWVIENVIGAPLDLERSVRLCGSAFGMRIKRHRWFESNIPLMSNGCLHGWWDYRYPPAAGNRTNPMRVLTPGYGQERKARVMTITGQGGPSNPRTGHGGYRPDPNEGKREMGCEWMTWQELTQSIPPAYTEFVGTQLLEHINRSRARSSA